MRVLIAAIFLVLCLGAQCQQAITLEDCLYSVGIVLADAAVVYRDRTNRANISKMRQDVQALYSKCMYVIPKSVESCDSILLNVESANKASLVTVHGKYSKCVASLS